MTEKVDLIKEVLGAGTYSKVVDTQFTQLISPTQVAVEDVSVEKFFELYEQLFFQIPVTGEFNSHEYLVKRSSEYIGGDIISDNEQALLEEINNLRQQLLEANQSLIDISKLT